MPSLDGLHLWDKYESTMSGQSAQITMVMSFVQRLTAEWHPQSRVLNTSPSTQGAMSPLLTLGTLGVLSLNEHANLVKCILPAATKLVLQTSF